MTRLVVLPLIAVVICVSMVAGYRPASAATTHSISQLNDLYIAGVAYDSSANRSKLTARTFPPTGMRAHVHSGGAWSALGTFGGFTHIQAHDVNDAGQAVGWGSNTSGGYAISDRAFVFAGGSMTQLPVLTGSGRTHAYSINNDGTIVGVSANNRAFKFTIGDSALSELTFPAGATGLGNALNINTDGDIVGFEFNNGPRRPIFWDNGVTPSVLNLPAGATSGEAHLINDAGLIAGIATYPTGTYATLYSPAGAAVDLGTLGGTLSEPFDLNIHGQVVGYSRTGVSFSQAPFLYSDGVMVNLNSLLPAGSGWVLTRALTINDAGEITGFGTFDGSPSAFKLTPIPEPAAIGGITIMTTWALVRRRRCPWE